MRLVPAIVATAIRAIGASLRYRFVLDSLDAVPQRISTKAIYIFWHEMLLLPAYTHGKQIVPLISRSRDGSIMEEVINALSGHAIRGSTDHGGKNRGGMAAMREMLRKGRTEHLGVPLDGPIGPRRTVASAGFAWAASRAQLPIIPVGIATRALLSVGPTGRKIDIPIPFTCAWFVVGAPVRVPANLSKSQVREFTKSIQAAMDHVQTRADSYARAGTSPEPTLTLRDLRLLKTC